MYHECLKQASDTDAVCESGHTLRKRKRSYRSERPCHDNSKDRFYRGLCMSPKDKDRKRSLTGVQAKKLRIPSEARIKAQDTIKHKNKCKRNGITVNEALTRSYPLFQTIKTKKKRDCDRQGENSNLSSAHQSDEENENIDPDNSPEKKTPADKVVTCKLITRIVGLKKRGKNTSGHRYKCPSCTSIHNSMSELNTHYKASHPPVSCKQCGIHFNTPSYLIQAHVQTLKDAGLSLHTL